MFIYNQVFQDEEYNKADPDRIKRVYKWAKQFPEVIDVGCGRGHYLYYMINKGLNATGIEPSTVDVSGLPVERTDILSCRLKVPALYCVDVLEHISHEEIDATLKHLSQMAPKQLLGIANHSDIWEGIELHLIQEPSDWWEAKLHEYYKSVKLVHEEDKYFMFEVSNV